MRPRPRDDRAVKDSWSIHNGRRSAPPSGDWPAEARRSGLPSNHRSLRTRSTRRLGTRLQRSLGHTDPIDTRRLRSIRSHSRRPREASPPPRTSGSRPTIRGDTRVHTVAIPGSPHRPGTRCKTGRRTPRERRRLLRRRAMHRKLRSFRSRLPAPPGCTRSLPQVHSRGWVGCNLRHRSLHRPCTLRRNHRGHPGGSNGRTHTGRRPSIELRWVGSRAAEAHPCPFRTSSDRSW